MQCIYFDSFFSHIVSSLKSELRIQRLRELKKEFYRYWNVVNTRDKMRDACDARIKNHNSSDTSHRLTLCHENQNVECDQTRELNR